MAVSMTSAKSTKVATPATLAKESAYRLRPSDASIGLDERYNTPSPIPVVFTFLKFANSSMERVGYDSK